MIRLTSAVPYCFYTSLIRHIYLQNLCLSALIWRFLKKIRILRAKWWARTRSIYVFFLANTYLWFFCCLKMVRNSFIERVLCWLSRRYWFLYRNSKFIRIELWDRYKNLFKTFPFALLLLTFWINLISELEIIFLFNNFLFVKNFCSFDFIKAQRWKKTFKAYFLRLSPIF